ncbi:MAG: LysM peptidoglycan-binding domain-containing protein [Acidobacteriota bacterium]
MKNLFKIASVGLLAAATVACCRQAPKEVVDATQALNETSKGCTPVYASAQYQEAKGAVDHLNDLVANKKCRAARKEAPAAMAKVKAANEASAAEQARAKSAAEASLAAARQAVKASEEGVAAQAAAGRSANETLNAWVTKSEGECIQGELRALGSPVTVAEMAPAAHQKAKAKLEEADGLMAESPCNYYKVREAADEALSLAKKARAEAEAEVARINAEKERKVEAVEQAMKSKPCTYTVQKGDCLWKIAAKDFIYNNPFLWPLIWDANRGLIKDHPDLIYPKWEFRINRTFTADDAKKAEKTARNHKWEPAAPAAPAAVTTAPPETPAK